MTSQERKTRYNQIKTKLKCLHPNQSRNATMRAGKSQ